MRVTSTCTDGLGNTCQAIPNGFFGHRARGEDAARCLPERGNAARGECPPTGLQRLLLLLLLRVCPSRGFRAIGGGGGDCLAMTGLRYAQPRRGGGDSACHRAR